MGWMDMTSLLALFYLTYYHQSKIKNFIYFQHSLLFYYNCDDWVVFCGMVDRRKAFSLISSGDHCQEIRTIANLRHAASRVWTCAELEVRISWMKSCSSDNIIFILLFWFWYCYFYFFYCLFLIISIIIIKLIFHNLLLSFINLVSLLTV